MTRDAAPAFSRTAIFWLVGLVAGSFILAVVWTGVAGDRTEPRTAGSDSFSSSALGHRAFAELLQRTGIPVTRRRTAYGGLTDTSVLIVAEPPYIAGRDSEETVASVFRIARKRHTPIVIVLPKRMGHPDPNRTKWIASQWILPPKMVERIARPWGLSHVAVRHASMTAFAATTSWGERLVVSLSPAQALAASPGLEPIVYRDSLVLVGRVVPAQDTTRKNSTDPPPPLYVVSDPDLINTYGLGLGDNAEVVRGLLEHELHARHVEFDETVHFPELALGLLTELFRFPLVLALIQGTLLLGFILWMSVARFGKARPMETHDTSRRALVDSIAGLLVGIGRPEETLDSYLMQVLRETAARFGLPPTLSRNQLTMQLGRIARTRGVAGDITQIEATSHRLQLGTGRNSQAVVRTARALHRWYEDMNHDR